MKLIAGKYFSRTDAQEYMALGKDALYKLIEEGYINSFRDKNGRRLIAKESIDSYFESLQIK